MSDFGKKITGLIGSEKVEEFTKLGVDAIGDLIGNTLKRGTEPDEAAAIAPPTGKPVQQLQPPTDPLVEAFPPPVSEPVTTSAVKTVDLKSAVDKIIELNGLREKGLLSDAEFAALKNELLS